MHVKLYMPLPKMVVQVPFLSCFCFGVDRIHGAEPVETGTTMHNMFHLCKDSLTLRCVWKMVDTRLVAPLKDDKRFTFIYFLMLTKLRVLYMHG